MCIIVLLIYTDAHLFQQNAKSEYLSNYYLHQGDVKFMTVYLSVSPFVSRISLYTTGVIFMTKREHRSLSNFAPIKRESHPDHCLDTENIKIWILPFIYY